MAYIFYVDSVTLPVTPSKMQIKINNQNKTITLINEGEVNVLKDAGLSDITFKAMFPHVRYPFALYPGGFKPASFYLEKLEQLKISKKPFQFICSRTSPNGQLLFDTNMKVSIEDYRIEEDASEGQDLTVTIQLKQWKDYGTKRVVIEPIKTAVASAVATASVSKARPAETAPSEKTYTVKSGDTLWNIAKKQLGNGSRYTEIANLNKSKIKNPNLIYPGQVLTLPS